MPILQEIQELLAFKEWAEGHFGDAEDAIQQKAPTLEEIKWRAEDERRRRVELETRLLCIQDAILKVERSSELIYLRSVIRP